MDCRSKSYREEAYVEALEPRLLLAGSTGPFPVPLTAAGPAGGLIYTGTAAASISAAAEVDTFTITLDAGQTVSLVATPSTGLKPALQFLAPDGSSLGTATASVAGGYAVLQTLPAATAGTYTIAISGASTTTGTYTIALTLNAAVEAEAWGGSANDSLAAAQNIDSSFIALPIGPGTRGAVTGRMTAGGQDWYRFSLTDGESASLALKRSTVTAAAMSLTFYDATGRLLATGVSTGQADGVVYNFIDATTDGLSGAYYAKVTGAAGTDYRLVVTGNAAFDAGVLAGQIALELPPSGQALSMATWAQNTKLTAPDGAASDYFGYSVSINGDWAIVGMDGDDDKGAYSGSAYIYHFSGTAWVQQAKLTAFDGVATDSFGRSVSISGDTAIVGATGSQGSVARSGAAYIYRFNGTAWVQQAKLTASDGAASDYFGSSVSISGDTAIVGAFQDDDKGYESGSAYVFHFDGATWSQQAKLTASDGAAYDNFGRSVSISGDEAIVGVAYDDDKGADSGSAYIYHFDGTAWVQQPKLTASDGAGGDYFGYSVAISGDRVIVGAYGHDGVSGPSGTAYIFHFDGGVWVQQARLTAPHYFGCSVAISGDVAIVGAYDSDSAYVYHFDGGAWVQQANLAASDGSGGDWFGNSVSISGDRAIVGAWRDGDKGTDSGSAYLFRAGSTDYAISVQAGDVLTIATAIPAGGVGEFANNLDPAVQLYDSSGALVAFDDNGALDGRNALLHYTAGAAGNYNVRVTPAAGPRGECALSATGQTGPATVFRATGTDIANGALLNYRPATLRVNFNDSLLLTTLNPADLTVGGMPATAVSVVDGHTVQFTLPVLPEGICPVAIAAGAIADLQGTPIEAFSQTLTIDTTAPRVIASSILEGQIVAPGTLVYTVRFDQELLASVMDASDVSLIGADTGTHIPMLTSYDRTTSTWTLTYQNVLEDAYTLTLKSGATALADLAGNSLDGEARAGTTVPSGNGTAGGNFVVHFTLDRGSDPAEAFNPVLPLGSLAYSSVNPGGLAGASDVDDFLVSLQAGETVTAILAPLTSSPTLSIQIPGLIAPVTAASPGAWVVLPLTAITTGGPYTLRVTGNQACYYQLTILRNAAVEAQDTTAAAPLNIGNSFIAAGPGIGSGRFAVVGTAESGVDAYTIDLTDCAGMSIDVLLTAQSPTNLSGAAMALLAPDGTTVLAASAPGPGGANYSVSILDFVVPTDGVYTIKITTAVTGTYSLLVARDLTFDAEPNAPTTSPLRLLDGTNGVLGALQMSFADLPNLAIYAAESRLYVPLIPGTYIKKLSLEQFQATVATSGDSSATWKSYFATQYPGYIPGSDPSTWIFMMEDLPNGDWDYEDLRITATVRDQSVALHFARGISINTYTLVDLMDGSVLLDKLPENGTDVLVPYLGTSQDSDSYQITMQVGQELVFQTSTPGDGTWGFGNNLDPRIEIRDPSGALVASDDNSLDGKNAMLQVTATTTGFYTVTVLAAAGAGEYILQAMPIPVVTVKARITDDATPSLTGMVDDPAATIAVTVGGHTYTAHNNADGTWTLPDDTISPALGLGVFDVQVQATDPHGNIGADATAGELTVALAGDVNLDGQVSLLDYNTIKANFGQIGSSWESGDVNGDGQVGLLDFNLVKANFGNASPPAPLAPAIQPMIGPVWSGSAALTVSSTGAWTATAAATEREKIDASALVLTPALSVVDWSAVPATPVAAL